MGQDSPLCVVPPNRWSVVSIRSKLSLKRCIQSPSNRWFCSVRILAKERYSRPANFLLVRVFLLAIISISSDLYQCHPEELPVRLAHRVKELDELPHNLSDMPSIKKVKNWYAQSFEVCTYIFPMHSYHLCLSSRNLSHSLKLSFPTTFDKHSWSLDPKKSHSPNRSQIYSTIPTLVIALTTVTRMEGMGMDSTSSN